MSFLNVEIKAKYPDASRMRDFLISSGARFHGIDNQTDTYFHSSTGRLKLREGNIENNLIYYERNDQAGPKDSYFQLTAVADAFALKAILSRSMGVKVVVAKKREIFFIGNVKFHIDEVPGLGSFAEIEASNLGVDLPKEELMRQCEYYMTALGILPADLIEVSYSDMLLLAK